MLDSFQEKLQPFWLKTFENMWKCLLSLTEKYKFDFNQVPTSMFLSVKRVKNYLKYSYNIFFFWANVFFSF